MKKRGLFIAGGAVLLCLLLGVYVLLKKNGTEEAAAVEEEDENEEIVSISGDEIANLTFELDGSEVTWVKEEDGWYLSGDKEFPVDESKMTTLISSISSISAERTLEDVSNLKDYGLENPVNVIKVEKTDESTETIYVGSKNPSTGDTYICLNDKQDTVYTVGSDLGGTFSGGIYDFAVSEEYPSITGATITRIKADKKDNSYTLESNEDSSTGWYITDGKKNTKEADSTNAGTLQSTVAGLSYSGYYEYDCQDWAAYGLDKPKMEFTVDYTEQVEIQEDESEDQEESGTDENEDTSDEAGSETDGTDSESDSGEDEPTMETVEKSMVLYVGSLSEDGNYYVRLGDSSQVHGMSQSSIDSLMNGKAFDYWKLSIESIAISDLDHLDVTYDGDTHTLKRVVTEESDGTEDDKEETSDESENTETVTTYYVDDKEADSQTFMNFYRGALSMVCQSRLEEYKDQNEPEIMLEYYGTDGSKVTIEYISRDSNFYTVTDQDGNYGLVNKMNVKDLISQWIELMNEQEKK